MADKKIFDLVAATGEEATDVVLSDVLPEVVKEFGTFIVTESDDDNEDVSQYI